MRICFSSTPVDSIHISFSADTRTLQARNLWLVAVETQRLCSERMIIGCKIFTRPAGGLNARFQFNNGSAFAIPCTVCNAPFVGCRNSAHRIRLANQSFAGRKRSALLMSHLLHDDTSEPPTSVQRHQDRTANPASRLL